MTHLITSLPPCQKTPCCTLAIEPGHSERMQISQLFPSVFLSHPTPQIAFCFPSPSGHQAANSSQLFQLHPRNKREQREATDKKMGIMPRQRDKNERLKWEEGVIRCIGHVAQYLQDNRISAPQITSEGEPWGGQTQLEGLGKARRSLISQRVWEKPVWKRLSTHRVLTGDREIRGMKSGKAQEVPHLR